MITFGKIKTKIEEASVNLYGKRNFKKFMNEFKKIVLENKDISEIFYIYDDLNEKKNMDIDLANDYVNESVEYCQVLIESNQKKLNYIDNWLSKYTNTRKNDYTNIDNTIYLHSIKDLETVLESKKQIRNLLSSSNNNNSDGNIMNENVNLPISTMVKIANKRIKDEINSLNESEKKEITELLSVDYDEMKKEISDLKENIVSSLQKRVVESNDKELSNKIEATINKIMESKNDHYNLYKLRNLNSGL